MFSRIVNGGIVYDANGAFDPLLSGTAIDCFSYTIDDGHGLTDTATVAVTIHGHGAGTAGDDTLTGTDFADSIVGGDGNDQPFGGDANDVIGGGNDDDTLNGGLGADILTGDGGIDVFVFNPGETENSGNTGIYDVITDFQDGIDLIDFSAFGFTSTADFVITQPGDTVISIDGGNDQVHLTGVPTLTDDDFIF